MTEIHACLCGKWVNLCDDPKCVIGENMQSPVIWWKEGADIWKPNSPKEHTMYQQDYVKVHYLGKDYRIHPMFIQVVYG